MTFSVAMKRSLEEKIRKLGTHGPKSGSAKLFWKDLANVVKTLASTPVDKGEILYGYKHVNFQEYAAVFGSIGIQYAVNEDTRAVIVTRLTICGNHSYPLNFEQALNKEP